MINPQVQDLISTIDAYLYAQMRDPSCEETIIVDWDGHSKPVISRRHEYNYDHHDYNHQYNPYYPNANANYVPRHSPNLLIVTGENPLQIHSHHPHQSCPRDWRSHSSPSSSPRSPRMFIQGYDPETHTAYDYDGRIMHLRRSTTRPESLNSEYYAVDAREYEVDAQNQQPLWLIANRDKGTPKSGSSHREPITGKKRDRVARLVDRVFRRLESLGLMQRLRENRKVGFQGDWDRRYGDDTGDCTGPKRQSRRSWRGARG